MPDYRVGDVVDLYCYWGSPEKTWNRGSIRRIAGVDDHLFKAKMPAGWFVIEIFNRLNFDGPCMLLGEANDLRPVSVLDLLAEL